MTSNALDAFVLPMVFWLVGLFAAIAALKALATGSDRVAGPRPDSRAHRGRDAAPSAG
jgi:hypothetical protein